MSNKCSVIYVPVSIDVAIAVAVICMVCDMPSLCEYIFIDRKLKFPIYISQETSV